MGPQKAVCLQVKAVCPQMAVCPQEERGQDDRVHEHSTQSVNLLLSWLQHQGQRYYNTSTTRGAREERGQDDRLHEHSTQSANLQGQHHYNTSTTGRAREERGQDDGRHELATCS